MSELLDLNKFTKQNLIGQGTFGQVYKVIEHDTENIFAAKVSLTELNETKKNYL